jgi:hypothetical protein
LKGAKMSKKTKTFSLTVNGENLNFESEILHNVMELIVTEGRLKHKVKILYCKIDDQLHENGKWRIIEPYSCKKGGLLFAAEDGRIKSFAMEQIIDAQKIEPTQIFEPKWKVEL